MLTLPVPAFANSMSTPSLSLYSIFSPLFEVRLIVSALCPKSSVIAPPAPPLVFIVRVSAVIAPESVTVPSAVMLTLPVPAFARTMSTPSVSSITMLPGVVLSMSIDATVVSISPASPTPVAASITNPPPAATISIFVSPLSIIPPSAEVRVIASVSVLVVWRLPSFMSPLADTAILPPVPPVASSTPAFVILTAPS